MTSTFQTIGYKGHWIQCSAADIYVMHGGLRYVFGNVQAAKRQVTRWSKEHDAAMETAVAAGCFK